MQTKAKSIIWYKKNEYRWLTSKHSNEHCCMTIVRGFVYFFITFFLTRVVILHKVHLNPQIQSPVEWRTREDSYILQDSVVTIWHARESYSASGTPARSLPGLHRAFMWTGCSSSDWSWNKFSVIWIGLIDLCRSWVKSRFKSLLYSGVIVTLLSRYRFTMGSPQAASRKVLQFMNEMAPLATVHM